MPNEKYQNLSIFLHHSRCVVETEANLIQNQNKVCLVVLGSCQDQECCESRSELLGELSVAPVPVWHTWSVSQWDFSGLILWCFHGKFDFPLLWCSVVLVSCICIYISCILVYSCSYLSEEKSHKRFYNIISLLFNTKPTHFKILINKKTLNNIFS